MSYIEKIAVLLIMFGVSGSTLVARSLITWQSLTFPIIVFLWFALLAWYKRVKINRGIVWLLLAYWILCFFQLAWYGSFHPKHMVYYPMSFIMAYICIRASGVKFFLFFEKVVIYLSAISLLFWFVDVSSVGLFRDKLSGVYLFQPYDEIIESYIGFYTIVNEGVESILPRNSGFAWEPGAFAVLISTALMINTVRNNYVFKKNYGAYILFIALLTSQSTTGYFMLMIIFVPILQGLGRLKLLFIPIAIGLMLMVINLPFMQEKIINLWNQDQVEFFYSASATWNEDKPIAAQRFLSFKLDFADFLNNVWLGYGGRESEMGIRKDGLNIVTISGLGKIMAKFGIFGILFFILSVVKSGACFQRDFGKGGMFVFVLVMFSISVSYSLLETPLFMCFWLYYLFVPKQVINVSPIPLGQNK